MKPDPYWIESARAEYEARPWVSWALRFGVPPATSIWSANTAGQAVGQHRGPEVFPMLVDLEREIDARGSQQDYVRVALFVSSVIKAMVARRAITEKAADEKLTALYAARGVDLGPVAEAAR